MRRILIVLAIVTITAGLVAAPAAAADATAGRPRAARPMKTFCRSTDDFLRFFVHAPKPEKFANARGKAVLKRLHATAPSAINAPAGTIVDAFGYLSRHGRGSLSKARDKKNGDALFRLAVYSASHCKEHLIQVFAAGLVQRRIAQAEATTTTTTPAK